MENITHEEHIMSSQPYYKNVINPEIAFIAISFFVSLHRNQKTITTILYYIMTQEEKDLLFKNLSARLPYGVKIKTSYNKIDEPIELRFINPINGTFAIGNNSVLISDINFDTYECKPYLFPLSSMTEEQLKEMQEIIGNPNEACISVNTSGLELWLNSIDTDPTIWLDTIFEVQDWCNKNHFDYRGLIPMGLAIDATNLNIY